MLVSGIVCYSAICLLYVSDWSDVRYTILDQSDVRCKIYCTR